MSISLSLDALFRIFRANRIQELNRLPDYFDAINEQAESIAAPWKSIANVIQARLQGATEGRIGAFDFKNSCLVYAAANVAGGSGLATSYRLLSKTTDGKLRQEIVESLAQGIGAVLQARDKARSVYDEIVQGEAVSGPASHAELRQLMEHVEVLLSSIAALNATLCSAKVRL